MTEAPKKTTIYDLAKLAGTSAGTVSAVVNGNWEKRRISKKMAHRVLVLAEEHSFAMNMQARALSREKSGILGMIVPMYDNRYFSSIAEGFETRAREAGYFPIVTCTRRDPDLEIAAARAMLGYQVEHLVCTGATDPDRIHDLCSAAGVPTLNLDLPGTKASSVISDNFNGALDLTENLISGFDGPVKNAVFIGGRETDHNTRERIKGFEQALGQHGIPVTPHNILPCGYAAEKAQAGYRGWTEQTGVAPDILFVNSTISLEGILQEIERAPLPNLGSPVLGCFDWDPFAARAIANITMVKQDVQRMLNELFRHIENPQDSVDTIEIQTILERTR